MKFLAFTDLHASKKAINSLKKLVKKEDPEFIISTGDLTVFEQNMNSLVKEIVDFKKPVYMIHGNHEVSPNMRASCLRFRSCKFIHKRLQKIDDVLFVAWGGGGFSSRDRDFEDFIKKNKDKIKKEKTVVLLVHGPPYGTKVDFIAGSHVGCKSFTKTLEEFDNIKLCLCGHIHETFELEDKINNARVLNPGPFGKIIDLGNL